VVASQRNCPWWWAIHEFEVANLDGVNGLGSADSLTGGERQSFRPISLKVVGGFRLAGSGVLTYLSVAAEGCRFARWCDHAYNENATDANVLERLERRGHETTATGEPATGAADRVK
jgi:hypothetical protein